MFHEVQRQAWALVGGRVHDAEGRFEPGGVERADAFGQEDRVPVVQGGVGQVAGWASAAPVEGDVGRHTRAERVEVGVGTHAFDPHDFVGVRASVKVEQGRVGEDTRDQVGVRGLGEFIDDQRIGVGQGQRREARSGNEAWGV